MPRCYFYGCWNQAGHFMHASPHNQPRPVRTVEESRARFRLEYFQGSDGALVHLDGSLAPRDELEYRRGHHERQRTGRLTWFGRGVSPEARQRIQRESAECPMGQYLRHRLSTGFTAIQWWDRTQGDERGACNSTILLDGDNAAEDMVAALEVHFPHVLANLTKAGVRLVEVHATETTP